MSHLRPCSGCARHVRASETACPFCDAALDVDTHPPALPSERLGRAARMAFGGAAAVAMSVAACDPPPKENIAMPYGAPPNPSVLAPEAGATTMPIASEAPSAAVTASAAPSATVTASAAASTAKPATTVKPPPTLTAPPRPTNMNKPYGAPPADGYDVFDV